MTRKHHKKMEKKLVIIPVIVALVVAFCGSWFFSNSFRQGVKEFGATATEGFKEFTRFDNLRAGSLWVDTATSTFDGDEINHNGYGTIVKAGACGDATTTLL